MAGDSSSQEAPQWPSIEGDNHQAWFFPNDNDHVGVSFAQVIIQPPFSANMESNQINTCMHAVATGETVKAQHVATTVSSTLIEISVESAGEDDTVHQRRNEIAYAGVKQLIRLLDSVEFIDYNWREF